jgi:hypothetical protein
VLVKWTMDDLLCNMRPGDRRLSCYASFGVRGRSMLERKSCC